MRKQTGDVLLSGLYTGLIGYFTIVVFFAVLNVVAGRSPFHTAALLGSTLFFDLRHPADLIVTAPPVLAFNMVHALVLLAAGGVMSWLVALGERYPVSQWAVLVALIFVGFHLFAAIQLFAAPLMGALGWLQITAASVAAAAAMGWFLLERHPMLRRELHDFTMGDVPPTA
jgi:hypothetical protein